MTKFEAINILVTNHEVDNSIHADNYYSPTYGTVVSKGQYLEALRKELEDEPLGLLIALAR